MKCSKCEKRISVFSTPPVCVDCNRREPQTFEPAWVRRARENRLPPKVLA